MEFLSEQIDFFLTRLEQGPGFQSLLSDSLMIASADFGIENSLSIYDLIQYGATTLGVSVAALIAVLCVRYLLQTTPELASSRVNEIVETKEKITEEIVTCVKPKLKKQNVLNLTIHDLKNFETETELENFYDWQQSLSQTEEVSQVQTGAESIVESDGSNEDTEVIQNQTNPTKCENYDIVPFGFDKFYRNHSYLPPFVQNRTAVEKYTETKIATLEADKENLNIQYTSESLSFGRLMELLHNELVPMDVSPERVTEIVVNNRRLSNDDIIDILCRIYDLCISNKVAEWSLHFRKSVQPYFRNRHFRKQFQTRPINDLLQDIQTYYSNTSV